MAILLAILGLTAVELGVFVVLWPERREKLAGPFSVAMLALVLCGGFVLLRDPDAVRMADARPAPAARVR